MTWKLSPAKSTKLVYYYVKLLGLAPFTLENNRFHPPTPLGLLYSVAMTVAHFSLMTMATVIMVLEYNENSLSESIKILDAARYVASCFPATCSTLTTIILGHKKIIHLMNELCAIGKKLETLGIKENPKKLFNDLIVSSAIANAIIITMCVLTCLIEPNWQIAGSIVYGFETWFNFNALLIFVQISICIRQRFQLLNEKLSNIFVQPCEIGFFRNPQAIATRGRLHGTNEAGSEGLTQVQLMRKLEALHLELSDLVVQMTEIFAIPILLNSFQFVCMIVISSEWIYFLLQRANSQACSSEAFESFIMTNIRSPLVRTAIVIFEVLMIAHTTTTTCETGNSTRAVLTEAWNDSSPSELEDEFFMFSIQLADKPVAISTFGLLHLDYSYVYKISGFVVTYLIVMQQFDVADSYLATWKLLQARGCSDTA